jgi:predicted nucleic acid-binding protein
MKIVLNTSPIIFLSKVDSLKLLADVSEEIYVPAGVVNELHEYTPPSFIKTATLSAIGEAYVRGALGRLHQGELEAIILAQEIGADYVVLDDLLARHKAHSGSRDDLYGRFIAFAGKTKNTECRSYHALHGVQHTLRP